MDQLWTRSPCLQAGLQKRYVAGAAGVKPPSQEVEREKRRYTCVMGLVFAGLRSAKREMPRLGSAASPAALRSAESVSADVLYVVAWAPARHGMEEKPGGDGNGET